MSTKASESQADLATRLRAAARELRAASQIDPEARQALADLVASLADALDPATPCDRTARLLEESTQLIEALHHPRETGVFAAARRRLEEAAARAETTSPVAAGLARQLVDVLSGIGV